MKETWAPDLVTKSPRVQGALVLHHKAPLWASVSPSIKFSSDENKASQLEMYIGLVQGTLKK